jgi:hypothetical protein
MATFCTVKFLNLEITKFFILHIIYRLSLQRYPEDILFKYHHEGVKELKHLTIFAGTTEWQCRYIYIKHPLRSVRRRFTKC